MATDEPRSSRGVAATPGRLARAVRRAPAEALAARVRRLKEIRVRRTWLESFEASAAAPRAMGAEFGRLASPAPCNGFIDRRICRGEGVEEMKLDEDDDGGVGGHAAADARAAPSVAHTVEPAVDAFGPMVVDEISCSTAS